MSASHEPMKKASTWPRVLPWLPGLAGLLGGVFYPKDRNTEAASETHTAERRPVSGKAASPSRPGATSLFLRDVADASAEECKALVLFHSKLSDQDIELEAIFRRWMSLEDPDKIWDQLSGSPRWGRAFFNAWVSVDEAAAMDPAKRSEFVFLRASHAIQSGHPDFVKHLKSPEFNPNAEWPMHQALVSMGRHHPEVAKLLATADLPEEVKSKVLALVAEGMAARDPKAAWDWLRSLPDGDLAKRARTAVLSEWLESDPQAAGEAAKSTGVLFASLGTYHANVLGTLNDPNAVPHQHMLALQRDPFLDTEALYRSLIDSGIDWTKPREPTSGLGLPGWSEEDPSAAARRALELPTGAARDYILISVFRNWEALDPEEAEKFAASHGIELSHSQTRKDEPTPAMKQAALADPEGSFAALFDPQALEDSGSSFNQLYELANRWIVTNPDLAATWLLDQPFPESSRSLEELRAGSLFPDSCRQWANCDPLSAIEWLESLPEGRQKTKGWGSMRSGVAAYDPALAFELSTTHLSGEERLETLKEDLSNAAKSMEPAAVAGLLESPGLSSQEKAALAEALRNPPPKERE